MKLKIGAVEYDVVVSEDDIIGEDGNLLFGEVDHLHSVIKITGSSTDRVRFSTLWHESIHGLCQVFGLEMGEEMVIALSSCVAMLLVDNPILNWWPGWDIEERSNESG